MQSLVIEFYTTLAILAVAFLRPSLIGPLPRKAARWLRKLGRRAWLAPAAVGGSVLGLSVLLSLGVHWPVPAVHDEFAYLLGADTFAHGRLTNSALPFPEHLETYNVLVRPTYQMKYPPAQSLALAAGQVLGHPLVGVWLSLAAACAALTWMLRAWVPPRWAIGGALLTLGNSDVLLWWGQSYWGGAVAMLGGALVYGALPRLLRRPRCGTALLFGIGLVILANSRPYEGLVVSLPAIAVLLSGWIRGNAARWQAPGWRVAAPLAFVLVLGAAGMGYYDYRVTGDALRLPYQAYHEQYWGTGDLLQIISPGATASSENRPGSSAQPRGPGGLPMPSAGQTTVRRKLAEEWEFYVPAMLSIPLLTLLLSRPDWRTTLAAVAVALVLGAVAGQPYAGYPHYAAPAAGLIVLLLVRGLRLLRAMGRRRSAAPGTLFRLTILSLVPLSAVGLVFYAGCPCEPGRQFSLARANILKTLQAEPGRHLVLVRYGEIHSVCDEWVYNEADLNAAQVVWARELSDEQDQRLLDYYRERTVWIVDADRKPPHLRRYRRSQPDGKMNAQDLSRVH